jgi:hypothetical protein
MFLFSILLSWRILHRYVSTNRRRYAQKLLYTQSKFYAQILLHRKVCDGLCTEKLLHTDAFTHRGVYTKNILHTRTFTHRCFAQRCFCTHKGTQAFLHAEPFTQRHLCTEQQFLHKETFTQTNFDTQKLVHTDMGCTFFLHRNFYTQKLCPEQFLCRFFRTETFTHIFLRTTVFTSMFVITHRCFYTCTLKLVHAACFYTQPTFT